MTESEILGAVRGLLKELIREVVRETMLEVEAERVGVAPAEGDDWDSNDVARYCGNVTTRTVAVWVKVKDLPAHQVDGGKLKFKRPEVVDWYLNKSTAMGVHTNPRKGRQST